MGEARGINDAGEVIGFVDVWDGGSDTGQDKGARWEAGSTMATVLNGLGGEGEQSARAFAINNAGTAVGVSVPTGLGHDWDTRAVRWDAGSTTATELEMLSPSDPQYICKTEAWLVSDSGMIAGMFTSKLPSNSRGPSSGVRWWPDGHAQELEGIGGTPLDMNAAGLIVGKSNSEEDEYGNLLSRAVLWGLDGKEVDLNTLIDPALGWRLVSATSISDTGWVAGYGYSVYPFNEETQPYEYSAWMMYVPMAVPEPAGVGVLAMSLLAMAGRRGRRG
ncbi:MAG: hypothetical protein IT441_09845 [Phycisphaeraceae bacterium]|nr:hypothetical protein [Phycisphaeraceae bacterium]